ncbi:WD40 repeat domain-containing protein [Phycicoccus sp.]|uniref:WD40 repeat domain-containing protein n=1 Tax=Phycicoccus sp. TaxID=1902410 RepID=UPI002CB21824|nr:WD40 repeat domain-containing protein [Phycicoccus sp.]HMM95410.1 WD40 repeat domain-containing protein [Phycicoccus sp.]
MTLRSSNSLYLTVLDPLPRERVGWWCDIYDGLAPQNLLASVRRFTELTFLDPQSDVGYGSVSLDADDDVFTGELPNGLPATRLLELPNYYRVMDNGVERFRFFYEGRQRPRDNGAVIKLGGAGRAQELAFATVLPAHWPTQTKAIVRKYVQRTWAYVWLELLAEAKARGAISTDIKPTFSATTDSLGQPWTDLADYEVNVGGDLLSLLQQYKEAAGFEWHMTPAGAISAATNLGFNRTSKVRFFEGINVISAEDAEDLSQLRNDIYAQADNGVIARAASADSVAKYRRRETFLTSSSGKLDAVNLTVNGALNVLQKPITSRTFKVPLELEDVDGGKDRRAFVDYAVSDLIGYGQRVADGSADYRVVSMAVKVDDEGLDLEVTVQSRREELIARLNRIMARQLGGSFGPSASSTTLQGTIKQVVNGTVTFADLVDVDVDGATDGQMPVWDASSGTWVARNRVVAINDLSDVDTSSGPADGDALVWDAGEGQWVPVHVEGAGASPFEFTSPADGDFIIYNTGLGKWINTIPVLNQFSDVEATPSDGDIFVWDDGAGLWVAAPNQIASLADVDLTGLANGDVLVWSTSSSKWIRTVPDLDWLTDVDAPTPADGDALVWDNSAGKWTPAAISGGGATVLDDLTDVDLTPGPSDGQALVYDAGTSTWVPGTVSGGGGGATVLDDLTDVDTTGATSGQVLGYDGTGWGPVDQTGGGGGATSIDDLTDVDTTTDVPSVGNTLVWDGTNWVPGTPSGGTGIILLDSGDSVPGGTAIGTIVYEKAPPSTVWDFTLGSLPSGWAKQGSVSESYSGAGLSGAFAPGDAFYLPMTPATEFFLDLYVEVDSNTSSALVGPHVTSSTGVGVGATWYGTPSGVLAVGMTDYSTYGGSFTVTNMTPLVPSILRLHGSGGNWKASASTDGGVTYSPETPVLAWGFTHERIGFGSCYGTSTLTVSKVVYTPGSVGPGANSGRAKGWWDGSALQPLA